MAKLTINEASAGFTHSFKFDYLDLQRTGFLSTGAGGIFGAANQKKVGELGIGGIIDTAVLYQVVDPSPSSDLTIDFGVTAADPDEFIDNGDVDAATQVIWNTGDAFIGTDSGSATTVNVVNGYANNAASAKNLLMEFNGTLSSLTAGSWVLAWRQLEVPVA